MKQIELTMRSCAVAVVSGLLLCTFALAERLSIPGTATPVYDPYEEQGRSANLTYLSVLARKPWWHEKAESRVPVLVTETVGLERQAAPVSIFLTLPPNALPGSIRVVTPFGEEIQSQVRTLDKDKGQVEVLVLLGLMRFEQVPLFVYASSQEMPASPFAAPPGFSVRLGRDFYLLENERLKAALDKAGTVRSLTTTLGSGKNLLGEFFSFCGGDGNTGCPGGEPEITEDGPIRKTIAYKLEGVRTEYSLYAGSEVLFFRMTSAAPRAFGTLIIWAPYGDCLKDHLVYETAQGLRRCRIQYAADTDLKDYGIPDLKEGWLAYEDERGEVGGEIFEIKDLANAGLYQHGTGYRVSRYMKGSTDHRGGLVAAAGNAQRVRNAYLSWKNPPLVTVGEPQPKVDIKSKVPVFGEDFIRIQYGCYGAWSFTRVNEHTATELAKETLRLGGNYLGFYCYRPFWALKLPPGSKDKDPEEDPFITKELIPTAHAWGVGIQAGLNVVGCPVADRAWFVQNSKAAAATGADMLSLLDEYGFGLWSDPAKAAFRKEFGMDPPEDDYTREPAKLAEPKYQNLCLFRMNVINDLVRDMTQAAKETNPNVKIFHTTSPNNLIITTSAYHDLETQSGSVDFTCTDLYAANLSFVKYHTKLIRGAMGNRKPVLTVFSIYTTGGAMDPAETELEVWLQTLWGSNSLWGFSMVGRRWEGDHVLLGSKRAYDVLNYTGLGDLLVKAYPFKYAGVLRDRDAFLDSVKRGESAAGGFYEHGMITPLVWALGNVPTDIVFSKYLSSLKQDGYKVLIVPNNPVLSPANAEMIRSYVKEGGHLIVEAEGLNSKVVQEMAQVFPAQEVKRVTEVCEIKGAAAPLDGLACSVRAERIPVVSKGARPLAVLADGSPAFTIAECGKGTVVYSPLILSTCMNRAPELTAALGKLIVQQAGALPVSAKPEGAIVVNPLVNPDKNVLILAVYNHSRDTQEAELGLEPGVLGLPEKYEAVELTEGKAVEVAENRIKPPLKPFQVKYLVLGQPGSATFPKSQPTAMNCVAASAQPGMSFLKLKAEKAAVPRERKKEPGKTYVGIFKGSKGDSLCDWGTEAIFEEVKALRQVVAEYMEDITEGQTSFYDVIIMPNRLSGSMPLNKEWPEVLRTFVKNGGGALMVHHAIGRNPPFPVVFPEVGGCGELCMPLMTMQVVAEHAVTDGSAFRKRFPDLVENPAFSVQMNATKMAKGEVFDHGFPDYFAVKPAPGSEVLVKSVYDKAKNVGDDATVVVGKLEKGKVVLAAIGMGCLCKKVDGKWQGEEKCTDGERKILINSVYWLAEK